VSWLDSAGFPASGRGWRPRPARDGSAASHLEGLELFRQGPPPFSRTRMVRQNPREGNQRGHDDLRGSDHEDDGTNRIRMSAAEPIPGAADGLHDVASELLAEIADVDLHHVGTRIAVVSPDLIEELGL